jgi:hypothetical protein
LSADLRRHSVDERQRRAQRLTHGRHVDRHAVRQTTLVVQERQEDVERDLGVRLATNSRAQELRNAAVQTLADLIERRERARLCEEELPITERVRVLGAERSDRRRAHVAEDHVTTNVGRDLRHVDHVVLVDGTTAHEHLAPLIEAEAPAERGRPRRPAVPAS